VTLLHEKHESTGVWPAAVLVRKPPLPDIVSRLPLSSAGLALWLRERCGEDTLVQVHCSATEELTLSLRDWAALTAYRDAAPRDGMANDWAGEVPARPASVTATLWAELLQSKHVLYLSALETQVLAPELAFAYNSVVNDGCLLSHLPAAHAEPLGPILMACDAGACSGWHRDGTPVLPDGAMKAGDVNACHWLLRGCKTWTLLLPRDSRRAEELMAAAPRNGFGNRTLNVAAAGLRAFSLQSEAGDVVLVAKHAWHTVYSSKACVSLAADRLFSDQLALLAGESLVRLASQPLIPALHAAREAAAASLAWSTTQSGSDGHGRRLCRDVAALLRDASLLQLVSKEEAERDAVLLARLLARDEAERHWVQTDVET